MKTNTKVFLGIVGGVIAGFVAGVYAPAPNQDSGKGDISKVNKYSKSVVSEDMSAFQEKILNDPSELKKTAASLAVLYSRMDEFDKLVDIAVASSANIEEIERSVNKLQLVQKLAENTKIAAEKAGIMKEGVPVVIGNTTAETRCVFEQHALQVGAPIYFAQDDPQVVNATPTAEGWMYDTRHYGLLKGELGGYCQEENTNTILTAVERLRGRFDLNREHVSEAFARVCALTGLMGRWQTVSLHPRIVCDTGHNVGGMEYISRQLQSQHCRQLHVVIGMAGDKDVSGVLALLPRKAHYYFTKAGVKRALPEDKLYEMARQIGLQGCRYPSVDVALQAAIRCADAENDLIFVGGSTFVVADLLSNEKSFKEKFGN